MSQFWKWSKAEANANAELILEGVIASESWYDDEVSPKLFREQLAEHTGDLTVRINSPGGDVSAGVSIYNMLNEYDGTVTIKVDGMAASIASVIAMAGDKIVMLPGSMMMVHLPWTIAAGNSSEMKQVIEMLEKTGESIVGIYAARTGLSVERINELLEAETFMGAEEAVELGFADEATPAKGKLSDTIKNAINAATAVNNAVMQPVMSLNARKAQEKPEEVEETNVTDATETVVEAPVETPEVKPEVVTAEAEADETDTEEETPAVVEGGKPVVIEETKLNKVEETQMSETIEIAKAQVVEPQAQASVETKPTVNNYLSTKASMVDFANVLAENAGREVTDVKAAWKAHVETKMGITNPEVLLPTPMITAIEDAFKEGGEIWNAVSKTGLTSIATALDTVTGENSRAKGHVRGNDKLEQTITIATRVVRAQFVYKYLTLDKETVRENQDSGALLRYVLSELPKRVVRELERAIIVGDGRSAGNTKITSFVSVKADAAANNAYASRYVPAAGVGAYQKLVVASSMVKADGVRFLVAKPGFVTGALLEQGVNGGFLFAPGTDLAAAFRFGGIITPDWMEGETDDAYVVVLSQYKTVGDSTVESFGNFVLKANKNEYLSEIYAGGALGASKAAVAIAPNAA